MMRFFVFAVLAAAGYYFTHNWFVVGGVAVAYVLYGIIADAMATSRNRRNTDALLHQKLSDAEKAHMGAVAEHQHAMDAHKAQFNPELRKKM
jgi:hypothetical protein